MRYSLLFSRFLSNLFEICNRVFSAWLISRGPVATSRFLCSEWMVGSVSALAFMWEHAFVLLWDGL